MTKQQLKSWFITGLSLIGAGFSWYLTNLYYKIHVTASTPSFCNINKVLSCSEVSLSPYSAIRGFPLAGMALAWFVAAMFLSLICQSKKESWVNAASKVLYLGSIFSVAVSLVYLVVMVHSIHALCLLCLVVDLVNVAILRLAHLNKKENQFSSFEVKKTILLLVASALVVVSIPVKINLLHWEDVSDEVVAENLKMVFSQEVRNVKTESYPTTGNANAPITIVEFTDFECPSCSDAQSSIDKIMTKYKDKVRFVFRNHPLDSKCSPLMVRPMHPAACDAAKIAYCSFKQNKFSEAAEVLYGNQRAFKGETVSPKIVKQIHLNEKDLESCLKSDETKKAIADDLSESKFLNVFGTPTFFINGYKIHGDVKFPIWEKIIDALLLKK